MYKCGGGVVQDQEPFGPVILVVVDVWSEAHGDMLVDDLCLAISLGMAGG